MKGDGFDDLLIGARYAGASDNVIQNRWLEVRVLANASIGVPATQEFYLGNLQGEINGALLGGNYFVQNADLTAALPVGGAGSPGSVSSIRDVDKNGFILNSDIIAIRLGLVGGLVLRNITIPPAGSGAALPRVASGGIGAPPVSPFELTSTLVTPFSSGTIRSSNESDLGNIAIASGSSSIMLSCIADSMSESKASKVVDISDASENAVGRFQIVDGFFTDLNRKFRRTK